MIRLTSKARLGYYSKNSFGSVTGFIFKNDNTLFLTTHPSFEKALQLAIQRGFLVNDSQRLTKLGRAMLNLAQ